MDVCDICGRRISEFEKHCPNCGNPVGRTDGVYPGPSYGSAAGRGGAATGVITQAPPGTVIDVRDMPGIPPESGRRAATSEAIPVDVPDYYPRAKRRHRFTTIDPVYILAFLLAGTSAAFSFVQPLGLVLAGAGLVMALVGYNRNFKHMHSYSGFWMNIAASIIGVYGLAVGISTLPA